jgi:hypothetical protein
MTIALALKVGDGLVFGADSAVTVTGADGGVNVYFNAEKVFNLVKGLPIGGVFYGLGAVQNRSMASLLKDLREEMITPGSKFYLDQNAYTIEEAARLVRAFLYEDRYCKEYPKKVPDPAGGPPRDHFDVLGVMIGGYSARAEQSEVWTLTVDENGQCGDAVCAIPPDQPAGLQAGAQFEAVLRLIQGWSPRILQGMVASGIDEATARKFLTQQPMERLINAVMPVQDAIELVDYLIRVTAGFVKFIPGHLFVAEPIDLAAITRHERFKWVRRKHYYSAELNPPLPSP